MVAGGASMDSNRLPRRLRRLILTALHEGWWVQISPDLQLTLRKPGFPPIRAGSRANDARPARRRRKPTDGDDHG